MKHFFSLSASPFLDFSQFQPKQPNLPPKQPTNPFKENTIESHDSFLNAFDDKSDVSDEEWIDDYYDVEDPFIDDSVYFVAEGMGRLEELREKVGKEFFAWNGWLDMGGVASNEGDSSGKRRKRGKEVKKSPKRTPRKKSIAEKGKKGKQEAKNVIQTETAVAAVKNDSAKEQKAPIMNENPKETKQTLVVEIPQKRPAEDIATPHKTPLGSQNTSTAKKRKEIHLLPLPTNIQPFFDRLNGATTKESFEEKGKFPVSLQTPFEQFVDACLLMPKCTMEESRYDDVVALPPVEFEQVVAYLQSIMPYNYTTITNKTKKHLNSRQCQVNEMIVERLKLELKSGVDSILNGSDGLIAKFKEKSNEFNASQAVNPQNAQESKDAPIKRFRWTRELKLLITDIVDVELYSLRLRNKVNAIRNKTIESEQTRRKLIYKEIASFFAEGWMTSTKIGSEYTAIKRKQNDPRAASVEMMTPNKASAQVSVHTPNPNPVEKRTVIDLESLINNDPPA